MRQLGIYVDSIEFSQLFLSLNHEAKKAEKDLDITLFFNNHGKFIDTPVYNVMPAANIWKTNMPIIATDDMSARFLLAAHTIKDKYFFIWSLDWLMKKVRYAEDNLNLYCNDKLKLLVRNEDMFNLVNSIWKEPIGILDDFDNRRLYDLAK